MPKFRNIAVLTLALVISTGCVKTASDRLRMDVLWSVGRLISVHRQTGVWPASERDPTMPRPDRIAFTSKGIHVDLEHSTPGHGTVYKITTKWGEETASF